MAGRAVLPAALMLEWCAQAAMHNNPGLRLAAIEDLRVLKGVRLSAGERIGLSLCASNAEAVNGGYACETRLMGGGMPHAQARVRLAQQWPPAPMPCTLEALPRFEDDASVLYAQKRLFHGEALQGIEVIEGIGETGMAARVRSGARPTDWLDEPLRGAWLTDPLALDCAFQLMVYWTQVFHHAPSLPVRIGKYEQFTNRFPRGGVKVACAVTESNQHRALANMDFIEPQSNALLARVTGYECVLDARLAESFARNTLPPAPAGAMP